MAYRVKNTFIDDFDDDGPSSLGPLVKSITQPTTKKERELAEAAHASSDGGDGETQESSKRPDVVESSSEVAVLWPVVTTGATAAHEHIVPPSEFFFQGQLRRHALVPRSSTCHSARERVFMTPDRKPCNQADDYYARPSPACAKRLQRQMALSEALDFDTPPRLLQQSVADISASKSVVRITLRKNGKLGLTIDATPGGRSLVVRAVLPDGLVEAWNRQCITGGRYLETVNPGDQITVVNDAIYCEGMLNEIRDKSILTLVILREGQSHDRSQY